MLLEIAIHHTRKHDACPAGDTAAEKMVIEPSIMAGLFKGITLILSTGFARLAALQIHQFVTVMSHKLYNLPQ
jgi:hypothetical protein